MTRRDQWRPARVIVDDTVIATNDPMAVIDPVWWQANFYDGFDAYEASLSQFTWPQRLVWAVLWHEAEVCNGGHAQFFLNRTGMVWPEALEGFEAIGCQELAMVLREAIERFPKPMPRERKDRERLFEENPRVSLRDLDTRYYEGAEGTLRPALMAYIRAQPEAFYFDGDVVKPPPIDWDED